MKIHALIIAFIVMITGGCASTETVKEAEGEGISRSFSYAFEPVYEATISAAKEKELEVVESDKKSGRLILVGRLIKKVTHLLLGPHWQEWSWHPWST